MFWLKVSSEQTINRGPWFEITTLYLASQMTEQSGYLKPMKYG